MKRVSDWRSSLVLAIGANNSVYRWLVVGLAVLVCQEAVSQPCPRWIRDISRPGIGGSLGRTVEDFATFDSLSGPVLVAGGTFSFAGTSAVSNVARWDGTNWQSFGLGTDGVVNAVEQFNDGTGPVLIAGGEFNRAGVIPARNIARWDGTQWTSLLPGGQGVTSVVLSLASFDDGGGEQLYVGSTNFFWAGAGFFNGIARWDGLHWSAVGGGLTDHVNVLEVLDDGTGDALYAGGQFTVSQGAPANYVAKWDGSSWSALGDGPPGRVRALAVYDSGGGPEVYAGGDFHGSGNIARWNGSEWMELPPGGVGPSVSEVHSLRVFDDGGGESLFVGGIFDSAGGLPATNIAKWDGDWHAVQYGDRNGIGDSGELGVKTMEMFDGLLTVAGKFGPVGCEIGAWADNIVQLGCPNGCYADCDQSTGAGVLDIFDFLCFQNGFVGGDLSSDCNQDCQFDIFDFLCFQDAFVGGCP